MNKILLKKGTPVVLHVLLEELRLDGYQKFIKCETELEFDSSEVRINSHYNLPGISMYSYLYNPPKEYSKNVHVSEIVWFSDEKLYDENGELIDDIKFSVL